MNNQKFNNFEKEITKPSRAWWLLIFFGVIGGIIGYIKLKSKDKKMARNIFIGGIATSIITYIIIITYGVSTGTYVPVFISKLSDFIRKQLYKEKYITFTDFGIIIEYPGSWHKERPQNIPNYLELYPSIDPIKKKKINAKIVDHTYILHKEGIFSAGSAVEYWLKETEDLVKDIGIFELISKDLEENSGSANFKSILRNRTDYDYIEIIKCNGNLFELLIHSEEPYNIEYSAEISRLLNSFKCK